MPDLRTSDARRRQVRAYLLARDGRTCGRCTDEISVHETPSIGHIKARVHGGTDAPSNLRLEHITCNQRAGASDRAGFSLGFRSSRQTRAARNGAESVTLWRDAPVLPKARAFRAET